MKECKKCLLLEAGEKAAFEEVTAYLKTVEKSRLAKKEESEKRLEICKSCDSLISGMCLKCGCYIEIRANLKDGDCPDEKW